MTILAILNRTETAEAVLHSAIELGHVYGGMAITAFRPRPDVDPDFMPTEEMMSPERRAAFEAEQNALSAAPVSPPSTVVPNVAIQVPAGAPTSAAPAASAPG